MNGAEQAGSNHHRGASTYQSFEREYCGRISYAAPTHVRHHCRVQLGHMSIESLPWPVPLDAPAERHQAEYKKQWDQYFEQRQRHPSGELRADDERDTILLDETLAPGLRVLYYTDAEYPDEVQAHAMHQAGPALAVMDDTEEKFIDVQHRNRNANAAINTLRARIQAACSRVIATRQALASAQTPANAHLPARAQLLTNVLFLGQIAILDQPFTAEEQFEAGFGKDDLLGPSGKSEGAVQEAHRTVFQVYLEHDKSTSHLSAEDNAELAARARTMGVRVRRIRDQRRAIDGLRGDESIWLIADSSNQQQQFRWHAFVHAESSQLRLEMTSASHDANTQIALWDHVVKSVRWHGPKSLGDRTVRAPAQ